MPGEESSSGFPIWIIAIIAILIIAGGAYYYYTNYMQPIDIAVTPSEQEDLYGPQLESLNTEIANAQTTGAVETARQKVNTISTEMGDDPVYAKYKPLIEAQLAVLDMIDLDLEYISTADEYADTGIDCSKDYDELISDMKNAESEWTGARAKVNSYLYDNSTSTATKLLDKLNTIDYAGMGVFAEMIERDYSENCVPTEQATGYTTPLSKEDALDLVVNDVVKGEDYYVYMIDQPLTSGTKVTIPRPEGDYNITLTENTWLFFLDSEPFAPFGHPTRIVLVSQDTAEYKVYDGFYYPIVDGISYWSTLDERLNEDNIVYPEDAVVDETELSEGIYEYGIAYDALGAPGSGIPGGTAVPFSDELCCEGVEKKKYGLVVQGYDEQMFKSDTVNAYNMLTTRGYSNSDITYLTANAGDALSDGQTTLDSVGAALNNIANNAKCCDEVFIYLSGHGASVTHWQYKHKTTNTTMWITNLGQLPGGVANWEYTGRSGKYHQITLNPEFTTPAPEGEGTVTHGSDKGGNAWSWEFAAFLDKMDSCYITFMYFSCYSGTAAPTLAGKGRTIITPVGDRPAWGRSTAGFGSYFTNWFIEAKGKAGDATVDKNGDGKVSDKEAFDYAKAKTSADATSKNRTQEGTYTPSTERCRCCHVVCDESDYLCKVVAGDGTDSEKCPKVGDYCGTENVTPPLTHMECSHQECIEVEGEGEDSCTTDEQCEEPEEPVCGDGYVTAPEECEYGTYGKNICPEGQYCKPDCMCHDLETSVVCGDGKISSPEEDCDGGNVLTDICPEGYGCYICKCEPIEAFCGDGMINPPEECDHGNTVTNQCPTEGEVCQDCQCIPRDEATHKECVDEACVEVSGYGEDSCTSDSQCESPTHSECQNEACIEVEGEGTDECYTDEDCIDEEPEDDYGICGDEVIDEPGEECELDSDCSEGEVCIDCLCYEVPAYCGDGNLDAGEECEDDGDCSEGQACGGNCQCVDPPSLNCEDICSTMGLPIILGHGYANADECYAAAEEEGTLCYTTCIKVGYERVDNIAGWDSCCCKKKEMFPCTNDCQDCPDCPSGYQ